MFRVRINKRSSEKTSAGTSEYFSKAYESKIVYNAVRSSFGENYNITDENWPHINSWTIHPDDIDVIKKPTIIITEE